MIYNDSPLKSSWPFIEFIPSFQTDFNTTVSHSPWNLFLSLKNHCYVSGSSLQDEDRGFFNLAFCEASFSLIRFSSRFATLCVVKEEQDVVIQFEGWERGGHGPYNKDSLTLNGMPKSWSWMLEDSGKRCNLGSQGFCLNVGLSAWRIISHLLRQDR